MNIFDAIPNDINNEIFEEILSSPTIRVERILSKGHVTPENAWYDQGEGEWIIVLEGRAVLEFENEHYVNLNKGDYFNIPPHCKHKVKWTDPEQVTIWLAVFYK